MPSWFRTRKKAESIPADETLIRVCLVSRDAALVQEVHKDLLVGFSTRGGYDFEPGHPDFQQYCDVLFVDLRATGVQGDPQEGLGFINAIRTSASHPPIVALCDGDSVEFGREIMRQGAYERLDGSLKMPQLRLALQRAYEFRLAESKLESFLSQQTAARENPRRAGKRNTRPAAKDSTAPRRVQPARKARAGSPSRLAIGFVLGCLLFFAGLVAVRTLFSGMGDALASAGFAAETGATTGVGTGAIAESHARGLIPSHLWPRNAAADFSQSALTADGSRRNFSPETQLTASQRSGVPGYTPAAIIERVTPRYSMEARAAHLQGAVRIRAVIGTDGIPRGLARVSGDPMLAQIAMDAIALWRYAPATIDGNPVESELIIPLDFRLPD